MQISPSLAQALGSRREEYNARFILAQRQRPELEPAIAFGFLREVLDPLVRNLSHHLSVDQIDRLVSPAFDAMLELAAQRLIGPNAPPWLERGWRELLPGALRRWPDAPVARLLAAISNALFHLQGTHGGRPQQWIVRMQAALPLAAELESWLQAGQVSAWLAGMAQYRDPALALLNQLPEPLVRVLLGLAGESSIQPVVKRLHEDRWFDPAATPPVRLQVATRLGSFRGFGGLFGEPPLLTSHSDRIYLRSADSCWLLLADAFGSSLQRVPRSEFDAGGRGSALPPGYKLRGERLERAAEMLDFSGYGGISSVAICSHTLALSFSASHAVQLVALT